MLVFPSNQFLQEPLEFQKFCEEGLRGRLSPGVWLMETVRVNGPDTHPLYKFLKESEANNMRESDQICGYFRLGFEEGTSGARMVPWNWNFFVVGRSGQVLERLDAGTRPESLIQAAEQAVHGVLVAKRPQEITQGGGAPGAT